MLFPSNPYLVVRATPRVCVFFRYTRRRELISYRFPSRLSADFRSDASTPRAFLFPISISRVIPDALRFLSRKLSITRSSYVRSCKTAIVWIRTVQLYQIVVPGSIRVSGYVDV